jgi:hypothetical protein
MARRRDGRFKYSESRQDFALMEINGKFWGSPELGLLARVNFGADPIYLSVARHFVQRKLRT